MPHDFATPSSGRIRLKSVQPVTSARARDFNVVVITLLVTQLVVLIMSNNAAYAAKICQAPSYDCSVTGVCELLWNAAGPSDADYYHSRCCTRTYTHTWVRQNRPCEHPVDIYHGPARPASAGTAGCVEEDSKYYPDVNWANIGYENQNGGTTRSENGVQVDGSTYKVRIPEFSLSYVFKVAYAPTHVYINDVCQMFFFLLFSPGRADGN